MFWYVLVGFCLGVCSRRSYNIWPPTGILAGAPASNPAGSMGSDLLN